VASPVRHVVSRWTITTTTATTRKHTSFCRGRNTVPFVWPVSQSVSQSVTNKSIRRIGNTIHHPSPGKRRKNPHRGNRQRLCRSCGQSVGQSVADNTCTCYDFLSGYNRRRCTRTRTMRCDAIESMYVRAELLQRCPCRRCS